MDLTGKSRAEIDELRALAAKAHAEGAYAQAGSGPFSRCQSNAEKWAAEELPYSTVTRLREVEFCGQRHRLDGDTIEWYGGGRWLRYVSDHRMDIAALKRLASLLTRDELLAIANGVCGPTEDVNL